MQAEEFILKVNEKLYKIDNCHSDLSLNTFIRQYAKLSGTKFMCREGGCGACVVTIKRNNPFSGKPEIISANSCITLLNTCKDYEVTTIEGLGNWKIGYHPLQKNLAERNGSQCGYCSPGMIMSMNSLMTSTNGRVSRNQVERNFSGNLCRCTGYRPILDAFKAFAQDSIDLEDIEDLTLNCTKLNNGEISKVIWRSRNSTMKWFYPKTIDEVFDVFTMKRGPYRIVAGNTASGVYKKPDLDSFSSLIDVTRIPDLQNYEITNHLMIGGNVTIAECIRIFERACKTLHLEYLKKVADHFNLIANVPVRNMATIAGNLMIKHDHPEFPSDIFTVFAAIDVRINVIANKGDTLSFTCENFLNFPMKECLIVSVTIPSYFEEEIFFNSYKITPRLQNAHAMVNAAFLCRKDLNGHISKANIVFGNINSTFIHASATERFLESKSFQKSAEMLSAISCLHNELIVEHRPPEPNPEYRRNLACGLLYKFLLSLLPKEFVNTKYLCGTTKLYEQRQESRGSQDFPTNKTNFPLTQPVMKLEALSQCSGEAMYTNDIPPIPKEVFCAFVIATEVNKTIESIDPSKALAMSGVLKFISKKDIPGKNTFTSNFQPSTMDEPLFVENTVMYYGQPCAMIVAETHEIANKAASKVDVFYSDPATGFSITTLFTKSTQSKLKTFNNAIEDFRPRFPETDKNSITGTLDIGGQYHFTMEPQTTVCIPKGRDLEVYCSTQWMNLTQSAIAQLLNIHQSSVQMKVLRVGGAYGAKITRCSMAACGCALATYVMNRPARFIQSIESMMVSLGKRLPVHCDYEVIVDSRGKISKLTNKFIQDYGWSLNESIIILNAEEGINGCYDGTNWNVTGTPVTTDAAKNTFARAPGTLEANTMCEYIMEHIAVIRKVDPVNVRLQNMPNDSPMKTILSNFLKDISFYERRADINTYNENNKWLKKGIAIACMKYPMSAIPQGPLTATVSIYAGDGSVAIGHGGIEMGQGLNTKVAQVAAYVLGLPLELIKILPSDTLNGANSIITAKSCGSENVSFAVQKACKTILGRLEPIKTKNKNAKWTEIVKMAYENNINLTASEMFSPSDMAPYSVWGCACTEILLDVITGTYLIKRVDILEDVGASLSPAIDVGQVEGAFVMGLGYFLYENLQYNNQTGKILTTNTWTYKIPGALDIPEDFRIKLTQTGKSGGSAGLLGSKGTGEPAICLSVSAPFAVWNAIRAARKDLGLPEIFENVGTPLSAEKVLQAIFVDPTKMYDTGK